MKEKLNYEKDSNKTLEILSSFPLSPSGSYSSYYKIRKEYEFSLLYLITKASQKILSHKNISSLSFLIDYSQDGEESYTTLTSQISFILNKNKSYEFKGNINLYQGDWDHIEIPDELYEDNEDNDPEFNESLNYFFEAMEHFPSDIILSHTSFFNKIFNYSEAIDYLKNYNNDFFVLLEKNNLSEEINNQSNPRSKKTKLI